MTELSFEFLYIETKISGWVRLHGEALLWAEMSHCRYKNCIQSGTVICRLHYTALVAEYHSELKTVLQG